MSNEVVAFVFVCGCLMGFIGGVVLGYRVHASR